MNGFPQPRNRAGPGVGPPGTGQPRAGQPSATEQIKLTIFAQLAKQGPIQGWQSQVPHPVRGGHIMQIFTAHRLARTGQLGPGQDLQSELKHILQEAITYERQAYVQSPNADIYKANIQQRMRNIQSQREQNSMNMRLGPGNQAQSIPVQPQFGMLNQNGFAAQGGGPQHMPNHFPPSNNHHVPGPNGQDPRQAFMMNGNAMQRTTSRPPVAAGQFRGPNPAAPPVMNQQPALNPVQQKQLNETTKAYMQHVESQGRTEDLRRQANANMSAQALQQLHERGVDVVQWRCREEAYKMLQKQAQQRGETFPAQIDSFNPTQNRAPSASMQPTDNINMSQFLGQQADAQRSQKAGALVVPASNNQNFGAQLGQAGFTPIPGNNLPNTNNTGATIQGNVHNRQTGGRPTPQPGMQQHAPQQIPGGGISQSTPKRQPNAPMLTGQVGGLHQQNQAASPMQWLNRPLAAPNDQITTPGPLQPPPPHRSQQPSPLPGAMRNQQQLQQHPMTGTRQNPHDLQIPANFPEQVRFQLASMPREKAQLLLRQHEAKQRNNQAPGNMVKPFGQQSNAPIARHVPMESRQTPATMQQGMPNPSANGVQAHPLQPSDLELPRNRLKQLAPHVDIPISLSTWGQFRPWLSQNQIVAKQFNEQVLYQMHMAQFQSFVQRGGQAGQVSKAIPTGTQNQPRILQQGVKVPMQLTARLGELAKRNIIQISGDIARVNVSLQEVQAQRQQMINAGQPPQANDGELRNLIMTQKLKTIAETDAEFAQCLYRHAQGVLKNNQQQLRQPLATQLSRQDPQSRGPPQPIQGGAVQQNSARPGLPFSNGNAANMHLKPAKIPAQPISSAQPNQRAQLEARMRAVQAQSNQNQNQMPGANHWAAVSNEQKEASFNRITQQTVQANPPGPPAQFTSEEEQTWSRHLFHVYPKLNEILVGIKKHYFEKGQEQITREMIHCIIRIKQQNVQPGPPARVVFTRSAAEIQSLITKLHMFYRSYISPPSQSVTASQPGAVAAVKTEQQTQTGLAAGFDSTHDSAKNAQNQQAPPMAASPKNIPAGASPQPSFTMGSPTPDGSVRYAQQQSFNLTLPEKKRRKLNQKADGTTGAATPQTKTAADVGVTQNAHESASNEGIGFSAAIVARDFKCSIPGCEYQETGFATQKEQVDHEKLGHGYGGNALEFCLQSMRKAFGLEKATSTEQGSRSVKQALKGQPKAPVSTGAGGSTITEVAASPSAISVAMKREHSLANNMTGTIDHRTPQQAQGPFWESSTVKPAELDMLFGDIESIAVMKALETGTVEMLSPPTPPPSQPSLSVSLLDTTEQSMFKDASGLGSDYEMVDAPATPEEDPWDMVELTADSGLRTNAFDEYRIRQNERQKERKRVRV